ncbi:hypothetical protein ASC97_03515 [Rhizobium sp. Root1203]|nr:hypothetical protein ASC97_03515 [Rhizobium sp. Root1203]
MLSRQQEMIGRDLGLEGMVGLVAPAGQQPVDADRIDDGPREDMRPDFGALLEHDDGEVGVDLLQPDRRRQTGRAAADDHHVEFHAFALGQLCRLSHPSISARPVLQPFPP